MRPVSQSANRRIGPESGRNLRLVPILMAASLAFAALPGFAGATNWGAGVGSDPNDLCSNAFDVNYQQSECTGDNQLWLVYIFSQVPANLRTSLTNSVNNDYDTISGITGTVTTQSSSADTLIFYFLDDPMLAIAYSTCSAGATYGLVNIRYHMRCKPHDIVYQTYTQATNCWNLASCRNHYACHELGHTLGLQHTTAATSCMSYASNPHPTNLRTHDINHLVNCLPHPTLPLPTYPAETRTAACKQ